MSTIDQLNFREPIRLIDESQEQEQNQKRVNVELHHTSKKQQTLEIDNLPDHFDSLINLNVRVFEALHWANPETYNLYLRAVSAIHPGNITFLAYLKSKIYERQYNDIYHKPITELTERQCLNVIRYIEHSDEVQDQASIYIDNLETWYREMYGSWIRTIQPILSRNFFETDFDAFCHYLELQKAFGDNRHNILSNLVTYSEYRKELLDKSTKNTTSLDTQYFTFWHFLPPEISLITSLVRLSISNPGFKNLPPEISSLTNLEELSIENEIGFDPLPRSITYLTQLHSLKLSGLEYRSIPDIISNFTSLTSLSLSHNWIICSTLPPLTNLKILDLHANQFNALPPSIKKLSQLTSLDVSENKLQSLPEEIGELSALKKLNLKQNKLPFLPNAIANLTNLTSLSIENNHRHLSPKNNKSIEQLNRA